MVQLTTGSGDGSLRVEVNNVGTFGSSAGFDVSDAFYDPIGALTEAGTTFESMVAIRIGNEGGRVFLTPEEDADFDTTTTTTAESSFSLSGLDFGLDQRVTNLFSNEEEIVGSTLTQTYTITNPSSEVVEFELVRYLDGDLDFDGSIQDTGGRIIRDGQEILFETDSGEDPDLATTFIGITADGGSTETPGRFEIDSYFGLRDRITDGTALDDIITGDGPDPDEFIEAPPYDVTLALRNDFVLDPGESTTYTTRTIFGSGIPDEAADIDTNAPINTIVPPLNLEGTIDNDNINGDSNDDRITGLEGDDALRGFNGNDTMVGGEGDDNLNGGNDSDRLFASSGNDLLIGRSGNDILLGGDGDDTLEGGIGRDRLNGGAGNDQLTGGGSIDRFIFNTNEEFQAEDFGIDTITDFSQTQGDIILLDLRTFSAINSDSGTGFSVEGEFAVVTDDELAETSGAVIVYNSDNGNLFYNPNGSGDGFGSGGQFATLTNTPSLEAEDFFLRG